MKIRYLGTAAAEGIPGIFCNCEVCQTARREGGRYVRTRSQLLIDDSLMVDFGADTNLHSLQYGINLSQIENVLITHIHADHFAVSEFGYRGVGFSYNNKYPKLKIYGSKDVLGAFNQATGEVERALETGCLDINVVEPYKKIKVGEYEITPLPANHGTENPLVYVIEKENKGIMLFNDSGEPNEETIQFLVDSKIKLELISYDCTHANEDAKANGNGFSHMGIVDVIRLRKKLQENGILTDTALHILTHFSHNGKDVSYDKFKPIAEKNGFLLAYDGYEIEV